MSFRRLIVAWALFVSTLPAVAQTQPLELHRTESRTFHFIVYGDTRFHDPADTEAANPPVRQALVKAIADAHPEFLCFGGDIVYNGNDANDWKVYDRETAIWREQEIPVYPALGNHDLHGSEKEALGNYFERYPELQGNRYYAVDAGNVRMLTLDTSLDEVSGPQGEWIKQQLDHLQGNVDFVVFLMHHPPYTSSTDAKKYGGGHSARSSEQAFARMLEERQPHTHARFVVFAGHVHNYERHEQGGVTYFVTGGGGAHAYPIERAPSDLFQSNEINYHYLDVTVSGPEMKIVMHRLQLQGDKQTWTEPDSVTLAPVTAATAAR